MDSGTWRATVYGVTESQMTDRPTLSAPLRSHHVQLHLSYHHHSGKSTCLECPQPTFWSQTFTSSEPMRKSSFPPPPTQPGTYPSLPGHPPQSYHEKSSVICFKHPHTDHFLYPSSSLWTHLLDASQTPLTQQDYT